MLIRILFGLHFLMCKIVRLLTKLLLLNETAKSKVDILEIKKAIYYAMKYHGSQMRQ
jgi:(p)ppGpp synthase/HD superfamily hydrolase